MAKVNKNRIKVPPNRKKTLKTVDKYAVLCYHVIALAG